MKHDNTGMQSTSDKNLQSKPTFLREAFPMEKGEQTTKMLPDQRAMQAQKESNVVVLT